MKLERKRKFARVELYANKKQSDVVTTTTARNSGTALFFFLSRYLSENMTCSRKTYQSMLFEKEMH